MSTSDSTNIWKRPGTPVVALTGGAPQEEHHDRAHQDGPEQGVVVDDAEIGDRGLLFANIVEMHQMVLNVFGLRRLRPLAAAIYFLSCLLSLARHASHFERSEASL